LLINTGTPQEPTSKAVREYLERFFSDRRIIDLPPLLWRTVLRCFILPTRPRLTVPRYKAIWGEEGSPYSIQMRRLAQMVQAELERICPNRYQVLEAHRYGVPSIADALRSCAEPPEQPPARLIVLPLYPQQAFSTTHSIKDELERVLPAIGAPAGAGALPNADALRFIDDYHFEPTWLVAVANQIRSCFKPKGDARLIFSFHSIPLKDVRRGDKYPEQVQASVSHIAQLAGLAEKDWRIAWQSRFKDSRKWLGPFAEDVIDEAFSQGVRDFTIICPNFAVDNLESLYDIDKVLRSHIEQRGGRLAFIPALGASEIHAKLLAGLIVAAEG
jgi:ferrochelatase